MSAVHLLAGVLLPESLMHSQWFAVLSMFVAVNSLLYVTLAIIKILPKVYPNDWVDHDNQRSDSRSIYPEVAPVRDAVSDYGAGVHAS